MRLYTPLKDFQAVRPQTASFFSPAKPMRASKNNNNRGTTIPYYGLAVAQPMCRDGPISRWRLQSKRFHGDVVAGEEMVASKSTSSSLQSLLQSAVVISMCSNYLKEAEMKRSKVRIVQSLSSTMQPIASAVTGHVQHSKQPPIVRYFSGNGSCELCFERSWDLPPVLSCGED